MYFVSMWALPINNWPSLTTISDFKVIAAINNAITEKANAIWVAGGGRAAQMATTSDPNRK